MRRGPNPSVNECVEEIQPFFVDGPRSAGAPVLQSALKLNKESQPLIDVRIEMQLKTLQPELIRRIGGPTPVVVLNAFADTTEFTADGQIRRRTAFAQRNVLDWI